MSSIMEWIMSLEKNGSAVDQAAAAMPRSRYAKQPPDGPAKIASATLRAVDQLGAVTADEIYKTADEVERGAAEIAGKLRELADAIRHHTNDAGDKLSEFCGRATAVFAGALALQEQLKSAAQPAATQEEATTKVEQAVAQMMEGGDDGAPPPRFLTEPR
jgi:hypothetical protein